MHNKILSAAMTAALMGIAPVHAATYDPVTRLIAPSA